MSEEELFVIERFGLCPATVMSTKGKESKVLLKEEGKVIFSGTIKELLEEIKRQKEYSEKPGFNYKSETKGSEL